MKLKKKYEGCRVTKQHPKLGELTFDANIHQPFEYQFFADNGFSELFIKDKTDSKSRVISYKGILKN